MKKLKYVIIPLILIVIAICIAIASVIINNNHKGMQKNIDVSIEYDIEDEDVNWKNNEYKDIELKESITISQGGTYHLRGTIENGNININTNNSVWLVLDNVNITCNNSSAINIENAKKVIITAIEGTTNTLTDGSTYAIVDEPDGALFSKDDLVINGTGTLNINANYLDGIVSKDGLKIIGTTINVTAKDDGIRGKDYVGIKNANITIKSESDGIKATNDTDAEKGYIIIENSKLNIEAGEDGIQAETNLKVVDGEFNIITGGGSNNSSTKEEWGNWNIKGNRMSPMNNNDTSKDETSAKGIKGNTGILIENGTFNIDSSDDSIHSNGNIVINNGVFELSSGDDGIHADESIIINNGNINISKSYEGIESSKIEINGGKISLVSSDDGINVAGGNDSSSINGRPGQNDFTNNSDRNLTINGGDITIDASGDGIDINGSGYMYGGIVEVNGPADSGNGALDYDGVFEINGGELIAVGASGMLQNPSNNSSIYSISYLYSKTQEANTKIAIKNSNGEEIVSFTPSKNYEAVIISSGKIEKGETYTIYSNDDKLEEITVNNIVTSVGNGGSKMQPGRMDKNPIQGNPGRRKNDALIKHIINDIILK